jgi:translation initiation factor eIF-2B subunit epsilon
VSGDTVSNMSLTEVLKEHQERRKKDKLAVMTMVVKKSKPSPLTYQTRLGNDELLLMIDPQSKQLLHYDTVREPGSRDSLQGNSIQRHVSLDRSIFHDRPVVQLSNNLQDCHIDICSPEVLLLFTDNFDYQQLRRDFVKGLLSDEVHCSVCTEEDSCLLRGSNLF